LSTTQTYTYSELNRIAGQQEVSVGSNKALSVVSIDSLDNNLILGLSILSILIINILILILS